MKREKVKQALLEMAGTLNHANLGIDSEVTREGKPTKGDRKAIQAARPTEGELEVMRSAVQNALLGALFLLETKEKEEDAMGTLQAIIGATIEDIYRSRLDGRFECRAVSVNGR